MAREQDKSIDTAQSELKEAAKELKATNEMEGLEDIFKDGGLVDNFQSLDQKLKLSNSPAALQHFEKGKEEVSGLLVRMAARGKYLVDNPAPSGFKYVKKPDGSIVAEPVYSKEPKPEEKKDKKKPVETVDIQALGSSLRSKLQEYEKSLKPIAEILEKRKEAFPNIMKAYDQESQYNAGTIGPKDYAQALNIALTGTNGDDGICALRKLIQINPDLPKEFINEMEHNFSEKTLTYLTEKKVQILQEDLAFGKEYSQYVKYEKPSQSGEKPELVFTEEGEKLPPEKKKEILMAFAGVRFAVEEDIESNTCPTITENFWNGKVLFEQGNLNDAKKLLIKFRDENLSNPEFKKNKRLKSQENSYRSRTEEMLKKIEDTTIGNTDLFEAEKLAKSGDIYGAKKLLKKYLAGADTRKKSSPGQPDLSNSAQELLKKIALVQLNQVKEKFAQIKEPPKDIAFQGQVAGTVHNAQYDKYIAVKDAIDTIEKAISEGKYTDFAEAYKALASGLSFEHEFNVLSDELILDEGKQGLLKLAQKYRAKGNYALAEQYYSQYFGDVLKKTSEKKLTMEELRKRYEERPKFTIAIAEKLKDTKTQYDAYAKKWNEEWPGRSYEQEAPWDETKVRKTIIGDTLSAIYGQEVLREQNSMFNVDPSSIGGVQEQQAWNEFMSMKGMHGQGKSWEPLAMSDAQLEAMISQLPVDIALIAISGGVGAAAGRMASGTIIRAGAGLAEQEVLNFGVTTGARRFGAYATGLLAENSVFTVSHSVLRAVRSGELSIGTLQDFSTEWTNSLEILGLLGLTGRAARVLKLGGISSFALEMATLGTKHGELKLEDLAMVLGLKIAHMGKDKKETRKIKDSDVEDFDSLPQKTKKKILESDPNSALNTHYRSNFSKDVPKTLWPDPNNPESAKEVRGWIDKDGKIYFNLDHLNKGYSEKFKDDGSIDKHKILPEGYSIKTDGKGDLVIIDQTGKILSYKEYVKRPEGKLLHEELKRIKDHEVTHRILLAIDVAQDGALNSDLMKIYENTPELQQLFKKNNLELSPKNIQELLCRIADGSAEITDEMKFNLERVISSHLQYFSFETVRNLDTQILAKSKAEDLTRSVEDAMSAWYKQYASPKARIIPADMLQFCEKERSIVDETHQGQRGLPKKTQADEQILKIRDELLKTDRPPKQKSIWNYAKGKEISLPGLEKNSKITVIGEDPYMPGNVLLKIRGQKQNFSLPREYIEKHNPISTSDKVIQVIKVVIQVPFIIIDSIGTGLTMLKQTGSLRPSYVNGQWVTVVGPGANISVDPHQDPGQNYFGLSNAYYPLFKFLKDRGLKVLDTAHIVEDAKRLGLVDQNGVYLEGPRKGQKAKNIETPYVHISRYQELIYLDHHRVEAAQSAGIPIVAIISKTSTFN